MLCCTIDEVSDTDTVSDIRTENILNRTNIQIFAYADDIILSKNINTVSKIFADIETRGQIGQSTKMKRNIL